MVLFVLFVLRVLFVLCAVDRTPYTVHIQILNAIVQQKRPSLDGYNCPPPFRKLIEDCWVEEPEMRPDFDEVRVGTQANDHTHEPLAVCYLQPDMLVGRSFACVIAQVCQRLEGMLATPPALLHYVDDMGLDTTCSIDEFNCPISLKVL